MELKIERNFYNGGWACVFNYEGQEYFADLCYIQFADYSECMIFATKGDGQLTLDCAKDLYCKRHIPVTPETLRECINEFIEELKAKKDGKGN